MDQDGKHSRRQSSMNEEKGGEGSGSAGGLSDNDDKKSSSSRISQTQTANEDTDDSTSNIVISPIFYHASIFLAIATLLQIIATSKEETGPFDWATAVFVPQFLSAGLSAGSNEDDLGMDGRLCPPDVWLDDSFSSLSTKNSASNVLGSGNYQYSSEYDPRNSISKPSLFPHCTLSRWVQLEKEHDCPAGQEYVTVILPPKVSKQSEVGKIPKIIHLSTPTNCLPSSMVGTLHMLTRQHISQAYTIYVHSHRTMDNFLFQREWNVFPQVKEGVLCGMEKLNAATLATMEHLKVGNSTEARQPAAERISLGVMRDIWRHLILWEYGGVTLDIDTLHTILSEGGIATQTTLAGTNYTWMGDHKGYNTLRKLAQQWAAEESDAILYFINNFDKQHLPYNERLPLTEIMVMAPHHPLNFYSAKVALKNAVWDGEKSITDTGRTTKIPAIKDGLQSINRSWRDVKTGSVLQIENESKSTIHFVDGDVMLPPSLTSPRTSPWKTILEAIQLSGLEDQPTEDNINTMMRHFAAEQKYIPKKMFSCMEYTLDLYLQKTTEK